MKTATLLLMAGLVIAGIGCSATRPAQNVQAVDVNQPSPAIIELEREVQARMPSGPADPQYLEPVIGRPSEELAISYSDGLRMRNWECRAATYAHGCVCHHPLWFKDPMDTRNDFGRCGSCKPAICSPLRFIANLIALPVNMVRHPCREHHCTDRTAMFAPDGSIVPLTAGQIDSGYRRQNFDQVP